MTRPGEWTSAGERTVYASPWVSVGLVDVTTPAGLRIPEHHVVRVPQQVAGCLVHDPAIDALLLIHRHRFIPGTWGWEVPAGRLDPGEVPAAGARRETLEETGWRPDGDLRLLSCFTPSPGLLDQRFWAYAAAAATLLGPPSDPHEAHEVTWVGVPEVLALLAAGEVLDSLSLVALLTWLRRAGR